MTNSIIIPIILSASAYFPALSFGQQASIETVAAANVPAANTTAADTTGSASVALQPQPQESKRIFGIIPNNRTSPSLKDYRPLSPKEKFEIARQDSFDRGTVVLAAAFAGYDQLTNANRPFGQGLPGYGRYFGASYGDFVIGNYMSEAIFPALLHQDPRYFRRGVGSGWSRLAYSVGQIFWTHTDSDRTQFNYSEILGNSTAVAISNTYYQANRSVADSASTLGIQIGVDMASNVLKEFWPDVNRKFRHRQPESH
jgi:hypothetical protein